MLRPEVSIIMPAYNSAQYIETAINSALSQTVDKELIIVDDDSEDDLAKKLEHYKHVKDTIKYVKNKSNYGVAEARNIGLEMAKGRYIAYLDADDWWKEDKLKKQLEYSTHKKAIFCYTAREIFNDNGISTGKIMRIKPEVNYQQLLYHNCIACSSVLLKREVALKYPMKCSEVHEDYLTWLRILEDGKIAYGIDEPLLCYRLSHNGKSRNMLKSVKMTFGVHKKLGKNNGKAFFFTASHILHNVFR